jgi:4-hydroxy-3-polyprenylbenzoate decarboxylase
MPYDNLIDFINELEHAGELVRISAEVDPILEITEIADRVSKSPDGGPALFFERVKGSTMPVVINLLGSYRRMCRALGVQSFEEVAARIEALIKPEKPEGFLDKLKLGSKFALEVKNLLPRMVRSGACQQVIKPGRDVDLFELPVLQCWPEDAGRFITMGQVFTKNPTTGERNVGMYRLQVKDRTTCFMHWHLHHDGCQNFFEYQRLGQQMPIAVSLGGDPVFPYMATAPLPPNTDECLLGGFLRGQAVDLVKCRTVEQEVPAGAEIVIEGYVDPAEPWETEGPFGDHTGFYSLSDKFPLFHVTAITQRANPIYLTTIVGKPPMEDYWLGKATERIFLPLIKMVLPELVDYNLPRPGAFHNLCFVSIRKRYPMQARKVMNAIWSLGQMMFSKIVVVVDEHVNVHDEEKVWFYVGANVHPGRDVVFNEGPTDILDHAAPVCGVGHKMGIDATRKFPEEGHPREWPNEMLMSQEIRDLVSSRWPSYGLGSDPGHTW